MTQQEEIREGMREVLSEDLINTNSTHEHAPPGRSCLEDCNTMDQGNGHVALMRSGGKKHKRCMDCWQEYVEELINKITKKQDSQGVMVKVERDLINTTSETEAIKSKLHKAIDAHIDNKTTFIELMDAVVKAGYIAVEPLI